MCIYINKNWNSCWQLSPAKAKPGRAAPGSGFGPRLGSPGLCQPQMPPQGWQCQGAVPRSHPVAGEPGKAPWLSRISLQLLLPHPGFLESREERKVLLLFFFLIVIFIQKCGKKKKRIFLKKCFSPTGNSSIMSSSPREPKHNPQVYDSLKKKKLQNSHNLGLTFFNQQFMG